MHSTVRTTSIQVSHLQSLHLPALCKRTNDLLRQPSKLWSSLEIDGKALARGVRLSDGQRLEDPFSVWLESRRTAVEYLYFEPDCLSSRTMLSVLLASTLQKTVLNDDTCSASADELQHLLSALGCCRNLEAVEVLVVSDTFDDGIDMRWLVPHQKLHTLYLKSLDGVVNDGTAVKAKWCPHLTELYFHPRLEAS